MKCGENPLALGLEELLARCNRLYERLQKLRPIPPEQRKRVMQKLRIEWNYHSNKMEGNSLTYGETKALIFENRTANAKPYQDHTEVLGHDSAVKWLEELTLENRPITEQFIRELHKLVFKEHREIHELKNGIPTVRRLKVGQYKSSPNHTKTPTGETRYFASPEETPSKMADMIDW